MKSQENKGPTVSIDLVSALKDLIESTSQFIELHGKSMLRLRVESQSEEWRCEREIIKRVTLLYLDSPEKPVLFCVSQLDKQQLTSSEYQMILAQNLPIGKVFGSLNRPENIKKTNLSCSLESDDTIASQLHVNSSLLYRKKYEYWVSERHVGQIIEVFNEESIARITK